MKLSDEELAEWRTRIEQEDECDVFISQYNADDILHFLDTIDVLKAELERSELERDWLKRERNDE